MCSSGSTVRLTIVTFGWVDFFFVCVPLLVSRMGILRTHTTVTSSVTWKKSNMQVPNERYDRYFTITLSPHSSFLEPLSGQSMNISTLNVRSMLPENLAHFFRYEGSLTTPPCYESILWTVFDTPITLSHNQVFHAYNAFQT